MLLRQRSWIIALFHVGLVAASFLFAWLLRFDFRLTSPLLLLACMPLLVLSRLGTLIVFKLVHGYWNHSGVTDVVDIIKAVSLGTLAFAVSVRVVIGAHAFPFSIYLIEAMTTTAALAGVRLSALAFRNTKSLRKQQDSTYRVIVVGAGDAAGSLISQIRRSEFIPVACVDDNVFKHGAKIHGVPVVNTIDRLSVVVSAYDAEEIIIAIPSATGPQ